MVPETLNSLRLALTLQARTAQMRIIHTQNQYQHSNRLQTWLHRSQVIGTYTNPIEIHDDDGEEVQVLE